MSARSSSSPPKTGVYFAKEDYVGLGPRIVILVVDSIVLLLGIMTLAMGAAVLQPLGVPATELLPLVILGGVWLYEVPLKRTDFGTLGYWLMGCKIVNLQGERPSLFMLTFRAMLWLFGPFNVLFDLLWCGIDEDRQTIRDRFSSTCLVKRNAEPIGHGNIKFAHFFAAGFNLVYPQVAHRTAVTESANAESGIGRRRDEEPTR